MLAGMLGASAMFGAKADLLQWGPNTPPESILLWGQFLPVSTLSVATVTLVNDFNGQPMTSNLVWGLICTAPMYGAESDVGLINGVGSSASAKYSSPEDAELSFNRGDMSYVGVIDNDGDGFGQYDTSTGNFVIDWDDTLLGDVSVVFNFGVLNVHGHYYSVSEPSAGVLTALGIVALTLKWEGIQCISSIDISAQGTDIDKCSIYLLTKTNLAQSAWTTNVSYSITGAVTRVSTTNAAPNLFLKVTEKPPL
jgi:hypothetical protein